MPLSSFFEDLQTHYYLHRLKKQPRLPVHVAIIMDGNGRWAKKRGLPRTEGHKAATKTIRKIIEGCLEAGVRYLSLFAFSVENWKRPQEEVDAILALIQEQLEMNLDELHQNGVKIKLCGKRDGLPDSLLKSFEAAEILTSQNTSLTLYMMVNYSGRQEILDAVNKILKEGKKGTIDSLTFGKYFYAPDMPDPDLIIRTSGEKRISNFLLWQSAYSELYFSPKLFPDFKKYDLMKALLDYTRRKRRFGGLAEF
jgi:undecaprenyl diphosphate synthase